MLVRLICFTSRPSPAACACARFPLVSVFLCLSRCWTQTWTAPKTLSQAKVPLWLMHYNRSPTVFRPRDYETPSGSTASALMTEKGSWPWHPEQKSTTSHPEFSQSSSFFFPAPSPTVSYHLKPEYFSPYAGVKQIHQNTQTQTSHIAKAHYRLKQRQQIKGTPQQVNFLD